MQSSHEESKASIGASAHVDVSDAIGWCRLLVLSSSLAEGARRLSREEARASGGAARASGHGHGARASGGGHRASATQHAGRWMRWRDRDGRGRGVMAAPTTLAVVRGDDSIEAEEVEEGSPSSSRAEARRLAVRQGGGEEARQGEEDAGRAARRRRPAVARKLRRRQQRTEKKKNKFCSKKTWHSSKKTTARVPGAAITTTATALTAVAGKVATATALVAAVVALTTAITTATATAVATAAARDLNADARGAADVTAVEVAAGVLGIADVLKLDKGKARGVAGNPDIAQGAEARELVFELVLAGVVAEIAHVHTRRHLQAAAAAVVVVVVVVLVLFISRFFPLLFLLLFPVLLLLGEAGAEGACEGRLADAAEAVEDDDAARGGEEGVVEAGEVGSAAHKGRALRWRAAGPLGRRVEGSPCRRAGCTSQRRAQTAQHAGLWRGRGTRAPCCASPRAPRRSAA
eukprot:m.250611 g.250611  ORF g.250611 m.250611 type:complete len:463 (+) comp10974_c0_seq63:80-1468(+)